MYLSSGRILFERLWSFITSAPFWLMTALCNSVVMLSAFVFYRVEYEINGSVVEFIDAVWWSFSTVTTVGYGDITPVTFTGKIIGIALMIVGTAFFAAFTALFANAILGRDYKAISTKLSSLEREDVELEVQVLELTKSLSRIEEKINKL
ncbi:potassium channel family protein [Bacteriovorax sp. Seq25_V]|uniref:potassium channel family protein n=1 Tax=Bacteriovorax sp. Seq25_V TaxID=1201288 RepID=UPI000389DCBF|nr:potassium channel family protein [Bacteriovorax sp. Seq25_V]EQC46276.1 ion channel [Bacteriovorax sp. Seq25_V]